MTHGVMLLDLAFDSVHRISRRAGTQRRSTMCQTNVVQLQMKQHEKLSSIFAFRQQPKSEIRNPPNSTSSGGHVVSQHCSSTNNVPRIPHELGEKLKRVPMVQPSRPPPCRNNLSRYPIKIDQIDNRPYPCPALACSWRCLARCRSLRETRDEHHSTRSAQRRRLHTPSEACRISRA